jgi:amidophosphoribosyltransferase
MSGLVGISINEAGNNAVKSIYYALYALQHRGQEAAGISVHDGKAIRTHRGMGLVSEVFNDAQIALLRGSVGIGHVRYPTTGRSAIENVQPFLVKYKDGAVAVAHDGNMVNSNQLREQLEQAGDIFYSTSDTEVIAHLFVKELLRHDLQEAVRALMRTIVGSYSLVFLWGDTVLAIRDPLGIRPLCIGEIESGYMVASESVAIDTLNGRLIRDVKPGELVVLRNGKMKSYHLARFQETAHCAFEYIYFARPDSIIDGRLLYDVRVNIGAKLAEEHPANADAVTPIPDSGNVLAAGYNQRSGINYKDCLIKERYNIGRDLIMSDPDEREKAVRLKMNTIRSNIEGHRLVLVNDSIMRGITTRRIVDMVRKAGAKEVHVRIGSPPIIAPCYLGINMYSRDELISAYKTVAGVEAVINADSLGYVSHQGLVEAIGIPPENLCMGCITGVYPVEIPGEKCIASQTRLGEFELLSESETIELLSESEANQKWFEILTKAYNLLAAGDYISSRRELFKIPKERESLWNKLKRELAFIFNFESSEEDDQRYWENNRAQIEWRRKVWAVLTAERRSPSDSSILDQMEGSSKVTLDQMERSSKVIHDQVDGSSKAKTIGTQKEILMATPERRGEKLEQDTLRLLRNLFDVNDNDVEYLTKLRQQKRGSQFGCDIKLKYCLAAHNHAVRCSVECKSQDGDLRFSDILEKILDADAHQAAIDHWILIAPRANALGNIPDDHIERFNLEQRFSFNIHIWTKDHDIRSFFGLDPEVYEGWFFDHPEEELHPRQWTKEQCEQIRKSWLRRLDPSPRLPQSWAKYVTDIEEEGLFIENDDRKCLTELWQKKRHIPPGALDASRSPLPYSLEETVKRWLIEEGTRVCIILGDFGDGKTAFTYMLSRQLLAEYKKNPQEGWIPVRFPLRQLARPTFNTRDFLRDRLEEIGSTVSEWNSILKQKNILVILDGMDEMTKILTSESVRSAVNLLNDCCNHEFERSKKVIITCRTPFFEELTQRQYVEDKLGNPRILYIERFDMRTVYEKLNELAESPAQKQKLNTLNQMYNDLLGLAGKALFFKMVSENLTDPESDFSSETAIYQTYITNCMREGRKGDLLENDRQDVTEAQQRAGMLSIMERIAMEIQLSNKEYVCLRTIGASGDAANYARILWKKVEGDREEVEDALHRIGVRSLLHDKSQGVDVIDSDAWPVEFCHRSVREFFVAMRIEKLLSNDVNSIQDVFSKVEFNHEILRFTAELMGKNGFDYLQTLRKLALKSEASNRGEIDKEQRNRIGRTSITLLFKWLRTRPNYDLLEKNWENLLLDGAQLAGADLTGMSFRNTSLRSANLNNAIFINADFRSADLTDARLEETGQVLSLSVPQSHDGFFAIYRDGSIRYWRLDDSLGERSRIIYNISKKTNSEDKFFQLAAIPGDGLCLYGRDSMIFLNPKDQNYEEVSSFEVQRRYLKIVLYNAGISIVETKSRSEFKVSVFDFSSDGFPTEKELDVEACTQYDRLGNDGFAAALEEGQLVVYFKDLNDPKGLRSIKIADFVNPSSMTSVGPMGNEEKLYLIACGGRDGTVGLWRFCFCDQPSNIHYQEIFRGKIHENIVTSLSFIRPEILLTGGMDNKILLLDISDLPKPPKIMRPFEMKLRCAGMKIDGIKGERERKLLKAAIESESNQIH